jgi:hypothetical protein
MKYELVVVEVDVLQFQPTAVRMRNATEKWDGGNARSPLRPAACPRWAKLKNDLTMCSHSQGFTAIAFS